MKDIKIGDTLYIKNKNLFFFLKRKYENDIPEDMVFAVKYLGDGLFEEISSHEKMPIKSSLGENLIFSIGDYNNEYDGFIDYLKLEDEGKFGIPQECYYVRTNYKPNFLSNDAKYLKSLLLEYDKFPLFIYIYPPTTEHFYEPNEQLNDVYSRYSDEDRIRVIDELKKMALSKRDLLVNKLNSLGEYNAVIDSREKETEERVNLNRMSDEDLDLYEETLKNEKLTKIASLEAGEENERQIQAEIAAIDAEIKRVEEAQETRFMHYEQHMGLK